MKKSLRAKAFGLILLVTTVLTIAAGFVTYRVYDSTMDTHYKDMTMNLAATEALLVDGDVLAPIAKRTREIYDAYCEANGVPDMYAMDDEELEAYLSLFNEIYEMQRYAGQQTEIMDVARENDVLYMYVTLWDVERGTVVYLMDGSVNGELTPIGWVEPIEASNLAQIRAGNDRLPAYITTYEEYGWLCTATSNIYDSTGAVVAHAYTDISMNDVKKANQAFLFNIALLLTVITLAMTSLALAMFDRMMVHPIKRMARAAYIFVSARKTNENIFGSLNIKSKDEIGRLSESMQTMENEINEYITDLKVITAEKERVGAELHVATQIQADMLPSIFPAFPQRHDFDIYATMAPAKEVGGDFYDFFLVDDDHVAMVMADVSGKGVPAALFMVIAKTLIKNRAQAGGSPSEILHDVNNMLCEGNKAQLFVTVWIGILQLSTGKGVAANAGHEDPVIRRAGGAFELVKYRHSPAVAVMEDLNFRQHEFEMFPGDTLFVYTDGVPEATNASSELYGTGRMLEVLNRHQGDKLDALLPAVKADIDAFVGEAPQFDDITMLGLDYYGQGGAHP